MALILDALVEILRKPTVFGVLSELAMFCAPLWVAVLLGLVVGWVWRPKCVAELVGGENDRTGDLCSILPAFEMFKSQLPSCISSFILEQKPESENCKVETMREEEEGGNGGLAVTTEDLQHLSQLVEVTDGGPTWIHMMDRSLPKMSYEAWRRDPEVGPTQYRSRTIFEDGTPETVRDFFWDDDFRIKSKWDDMLIHRDTLEKCDSTGTMLVHWVRKFPFFCSDREYTIGRRIWSSGNSYYCVTKGVPCPSVPRLNKPRRVDLFYSSWCIRPAPSRLDGRVTACEVLLFHHEDMGIPGEIAKLGIRQGMWGCVKRIDPGLRAYQRSREAGEPLSHCAQMAHVNTKVSADYLRQLESKIDSSETEIEIAEKGKELGSLPKFLVVGGAIALACTLDRGLLTEAVIFGVARRFANVGR